MSVRCRTGWWSIYSSGRYMIWTDLLDIWREPGMKLVIFWQLISGRSAASWTKTRKICWSFIGLPLKKWSSRQASASGIHLCEVCLILLLEIGHQRMAEHKVDTLNDDQIKILALLAVGTQKEKLQSNSAWALKLSGWKQAQFSKRLMPPISYRRFFGQPRNSKVLAT